MKKVFTLLSFCFLLSMTSFSQNINSVESYKAIEKAAKKIVQELSKEIEVSNYQQKSTLKILIKVAREQEKIENSNKGASQKTKDFENLEKKKEYGLRGILNDQQYEMLLSILDND